MMVQLPHKVLSIPATSQKIRNEGKLQYLVITGLTFPAALVFLILLFAEH